MIITIGGIPGAGKSVIGEVLAKKLKLRHYSMGDLVRKIASEHGMNLVQFEKVRNKNAGYDKELDNYQKKLGKEDDNFVIDGRLSFYFIPNSIKIFLDVNPKTAAERIFKKQRKTEMKYKTVNDALKAINKRKAYDKILYKKIYNIDYLDKKKFDYVIDTSKLSIKEVVNKILKDCIKKI